VNENDVLVFDTFARPLYTAHRACGNSVAVGRVSFTCRDEVVDAVRDLNLPASGNYGLGPSHLAWSRKDRRQFSGDAGLRIPGIVLLHRLIPLFLSTLQDRVSIFGQNILLLDHFIHRVTVTPEIFIAAGVSFRNASAGIAVFLAFF
jgi:hypothetical protein